jgi:hypothetical protein
MKEKLIALALAAAICLTVVPAALAAGHSGGPGGAGPGGGRPAKPAKPKPAKGKPFACKGAVVSVDAATGTLLVTVKQGSRDMRPYIGQQESFTLGAHASLFIRTVDPTTGSVVLTPATIDQVTAAVKAAISGGLKGKASAPLFTAQRVVVTLPATPTPAPTSSDSPSPTPSDSPSPAA